MREKEKIKERYKEMKEKNENIKNIGEKKLKKREECKREKKKEEMRRKNKNEGWMK